MSAYAADDQPTCGLCGNDVPDYGMACGYCDGTDPELEAYFDQLRKDMA